MASVVGKIGVPDAVLFKPSGLTPDEYEVLKRHTVIGDRLCGDLRALSLVRPIVRHHHERLDGSGYPHGLAQDAIGVPARLIRIAEHHTIIERGRVAWQGSSAALDADHALWHRYLGV